MHILIGILVVVGGFLAGLYYWLSGHWFVRVLAFLVLAPIGAFFGACLSGGVAAGGLEIIAALVGAAVAWPVASIPIYIQRHKDRQERYELAALDLRLLSQEPVGPQPPLQITHQPRWWDELGG